MKRKNKGQSNPKKSKDRKRRRRKQGGKFYWLNQKKACYFAPLFVWANNFRVNLNNFTLPAICRPLKIGISCSYDSSGKVLR